jgi:hypothetical protein
VTDYTAQPGVYPAPDRRTADRHAAFALDLVELLADDDRRAASALMERLRADATIDPWMLAICAGRLAGTRDFPRRRPPPTRT